LLSIDFANSLLISTTQFNSTLHQGQCQSIWIKPQNNFDNAPVCHQPNEMQQRQPNKTYYQRKNGKVINVLCLEDSSSLPCQMINEQIPWIPQIFLSGTLLILLQSVERMAITGCHHPAL
jgi:hypothetical protein